MAEGLWVHEKVGLGILPRKYSKTFQADPFLLYGNEPRASGLKRALKNIIFHLEGP